MVSLHYQKRTVMIYPDRQYLLKGFCDNSKRKVTTDKNMGYTRFFHKDGEHCYELRQYLREKVYTTMYMNGQKVAEYMTEIYDYIEENNLHQPQQ